MKKIMYVIILSTACISSCKKEGCTDSNATNYNPKAKKDNGSCIYAQTSQTEFTWKEDNGPDIIADSAFWTTGNWGTGIRAYKNGMANFFEINWDNPNNTAPGGKTLSAPYGFTFMKNAVMYTNSGTSTVTITAFSNNRMSGNFTIPVSGGSIQTVQASFSGIPQK